VIVKPLESRGPAPLGAVGPGEKRKTCCSSDEVLMALMNTPSIDGTDEDKKY